MVSFSGVQPGGTPGLGNKANTVTPRSAKPARKASGATVDRYRRRLRFERRQVSRSWLLEDATEMVGHEDAALAALRPARCGWASGSHVGIHRGEHGARYSGVQTCASIWSCPTCSPVIRSRRSAEVQQAAGWHVAENQGYFLFATFTLRHKKKDPLERSMTALTGAFTRVIRGAPWKRFAKRHGILHMIKSVEVTFSYDNGWHAHLHVLFFTEAVQNGHLLEEARAWLTDRWIQMVMREAPEMKPSRLYGVDLRMVQDGSVVAEYITKLQEHDEARDTLRQRRGKIGLEMTRIDLKRGHKASLVPFDLLDLDGLNDKEREKARVRWLEYVEVTRGRRATTWSRGLKEAAGIDELSDEELVDAEQAEVEEDRAVVMITARNWRYIMNRPDVVARLLELVEEGRIGEISEYIPVLTPVPQRA